jgi:hypothetical protein
MSAVVGEGRRFVDAIERGDAFVLVSTRVCLYLVITLSTTGSRSRHSPMSARSIKIDKSRCRPGPAWAYLVPFKWTSLNRG